MFNVQSQRAKQEPSPESVRIEYSRDTYTSYCTKYIDAHTNVCAHFFKVATFMAGIYSPTKRFIA